jgi:hypothetical protein
MDIPKITNEEEALAAIKQDGFALEDIPENLKTAKICLEAVKERYSAFPFMPEDMREKFRRRLESIL